MVGFESSNHSILTKNGDETAHAALQAIHSILYPIYLML